MVVISNHSEKTSVRDKYAVNQTVAKDFSLVPCSYDMMVRLCITLKKGYGLKPHPFKYFIN